MGATDFYTRAKGKDAREAFQKARAKAQHEDGHGGYTGTIAEKSTFVEISVPAGEEPALHASNLMQNGDKRIDDKWGPAGCVKLREGEFLFFGWASE